MATKLLDQPLKAKFFIIRTGYNNRALTDKNCRDEMENAMEVFPWGCEGWDREQQASHVVTETPSVDASENNNDDETPRVGIVKASDVLRLLYTVHWGYTWIDEETADGRVYDNGNDPVYIATVRELLSKANIDDRGCFVFESTHPIEFSLGEFLTLFLGSLVGMEFCGFFKLDHITDCNYYPEAECIVARFDTESG